MQSARSPRFWLSKRHSIFSGGNAQVTLFSGPFGGKGLRRARVVPMCPLGGGLGNCQGGPKPV